MNDTTEKTKTYTRKPYINFYKPLQKADAGAALQFSYDAGKVDQRGAIFLEATKQQGPKLAIGAKEQFDWSKKIVFKIGTPDIAKMLMVMNGRKKEAKCLHSLKDKGSTSVLELTQGEYNGEVNFKIQLSRTMNGETQRVGMFISAEEMGVFAVFIRASLERMLGF